MSSSFSADQIIALSTLLHHHRLVSYRKAKTSETKLAEEFGVTSSEFNNFLRQGAEGRKTHAVEKITKKLKEIYIEKGEIAALPDHIRQACSEAFPDDPSVTRILRGDIGAIFTDCATLHEEDWHNLDTKTAGIYDIYRYGARVLPEESPKPTGDENDERGFISNVIRAAMRIYPRESKHNFPRFELHYSPMKRSDKRPLRKSKGSVVVVGHQMYLIGKEDTHRNPLFIVCKFVPQDPSDFNGLVIRNHEIGGQAFCSRAYFRKNESVASLDELEGELGVMWETELPKDIRDLRHRFLNTIEFGAKGALLI